MVIGLISFPSITPHSTEAIASIPVDLISEDPTVAGDEKAEKKEISQPRAEPAPVVKPAEEEVIKDKALVDPKTAPAPKPVEPPPEEKAEEKPEEKKEAAKPAETDPEGLLKKLEEAKKEEEKKKQEEEQKKLAEKKREEEKKKAEEKKRLAEEKRKLEEKRLAQQAEKFDADKISNLLNNQEGAQKAKAEQGEKKTASLGANKGTGTKLTQSQLGLLKGMIADQIRPCWVTPPSATGANYSIAILIGLNREGSLTGQPEVTNSDADPSFRAASGAAVRAILRCSPLKLPAEMYDNWNEIEFSFNINDF